MPRRPRCWLQDGTFHVGSRATGGGTAFVDGIDRDAFVDLLYQAANKFDVRLLAWTVLGTHYHLIVEATHEQLSGMMHRLIGLYAQRFNRRHSRKGHLFEERFSSWVIRDEAHMHATITYILENPVRAGLCVDARDWLWSWSRHTQRTVPLSLAALGSRGGG